MRKRRLFVAALFVVLIAALVNIAVAADRPVKPAVDFSATLNPRLNGTTSSLGRTGVVVKIRNAAIANDGTITVRATIVDSDGIPLDRLGVATKGPVTLRYIAAYIPSGQTQYFAYTTATAKATLNNNPSQVQASTDSGGTFTDNAIGDYTYTFKTKAPANFDAKATHAIGVSAQRDLSKYGTFDEWSETSNDVYNFVPAGGTPVTRSVVTTAACNQCHDPLVGHGGSRLTVEMCILCHTPQTINPDTQLTQDMPVLIHKIHMGSSLPSVKAGTPYRIWHRSQWSDFSTVVFPQDVRNCTTCHAKDAPQANNWKTQPSRAVCGSCHDDVNFATGANHLSMPQTSDSQCQNCHPAEASLDFDTSVTGAHLIQSNSTSLPGLVTKIIKVDGATPGSAPVVTFSLNDKSGAPVDITKLASIRIILGGPNTDYGTGPGGIRASEDPTKTSTGSNGVYTYTMTNKVPAAAAGSYTIALEARASVTLLPGTMKETIATDAAKPVRYYFAVDKSQITPRRQVVSTDKCAACHKDLGFVHGGTRNDTQECTICHNPTLVDGTSKQSVNMAWQIHSTHRGENLANPYKLGTTNYQEVRFPGDLRNCSACHVNSTYLVENVGAKAAVASPGGFMPTTAPISAACQGCHDDMASASHALANTTQIGEACAACHSAGEQFSVDRVHQRIF
jgi:OmcA/MtrC family decaheme c-type cytochrome